MSVKPEDVELHKEGMPGKDDKEGLVKLVAEGRVNGNNQQGAYNKATENLKNIVAKKGVREAYYFDQIAEMPSDSSYEVSVAAWYDPNAIEKDQSISYISLHKPILLYKSDNLLFEALILLMSLNGEYKDVEVESIEDRGSSEVVQ